MSSHTISPRNRNQVGGLAERIDRLWGLAEEISQTGTHMFQLAPESFFASTRRMTGVQTEVNSRLKVGKGKVSILCWITYL